MENQFRQKWKLSQLRHVPGCNLQYLLWTFGNIVWLFQHLLTPGILMATCALWSLTGFSWKAVATCSHFDPLAGKQMLLFIQKTTASVCTNREKEECLHLLSSPTKFFKELESFPPGYWVSLTLGSFYGSLIVYAIALAFWIL